MSSESKETVVSEATLIPVSLLIVFIVCSVTVGATFFKVNAHGEEINHLKTKDEKIDEVIVEVKESLARIEGKLGIDPKKK